MWLLQLWGIFTVLLDILVHGVVCGIFCIFGRAFAQLDCTVCAVNDCVRRNGGNNIWGNSLYGNMVVARSDRGRGRGGRVGEQSTTAARRDVGFQQGDKPTVVSNPSAGIERREIFGMYPKGLRTAYHNGVRGFDARRAYHVDYFLRLL